MDAELSIKKHKITGKNTVSLHLIVDQASLPFFKAMFRPVDMLDIHSETSCDAAYRTMRDVAKAIQEMPRNLADYDKIATESDFAGKTVDEFLDWMKTLPNSDTSPETGRNNMARINRAWISIKDSLPPDLRESMQSTIDLTKMLIM